MPGTDRFVSVRNGPSSSTDSALTLHVRVWEGTDVPFVLVHGLSSNCRTWEGVADRLAAAGHPVVTVDQRGHGLSDKPDSGYDFATITEDLALLLDALGLERPVLAGQSWGGNVMLEFGARYGQRTRGIALVDGGYIDLQGRPDATWERTRVSLRPPNLLGTPRVQMKQRMREFHPDWREEGIEATLANFETLDDGTVRPWLTLERHLKILRALWEQRPRELYPQVDTPVLICAADDARNPEWMAVKHGEVDAAAAALPRSTVQWFEKADHDIHVQHPERLADLFLNTLHRGIWLNA